MSDSLPTMAIGIDGSGYFNGRSFTEIEFSGKHAESGEEWLYLVKFLETVDSSAPAECQRILEIIDYYRVLQGLLDVRKTSLLDFRPIVYDNASVNTGWRAGVGALLEEKRKELHSTAFPDEPYHPLLRLRCIDHIANLVPKHFQHELLALTEDANIPHLLSGREHASNHVVRWVHLVIGGSNQRVFRHFCRAAGLNDPPSLRRIDSSRYINLEVGMQTVYHYFPIIILFLVSHRNSLLKENGYRNLELLLDPDVLAVIRLRALMCDKFLRPFMKEAAGFDTAQSHANRLANWRSYLQREIQSGDFSLLEEEQESIVSTPYNALVNDFVRCFRANSDLQTFIEKLELPSEGSFYALLHVLQRNLLNSVAENLTAMEDSNLADHVARINGSNVPPTHLEVFDQLKVLCKALSAEDNLIGLENVKSLSQNNVSSRWRSLVKRIKQYYSAYLTAILLMIERHLSDFIRQALELPPFPTIEIRPTNRPGESRFGIFKNLIKCNTNKCAFLLEAEIRARDFSPSEILGAMRDYWRRFHLCFVASKLVSRMPTRNNVDAAHANRLQDKLSKSAMWSPKNLYRHLVEIMIVDQMKLPKSTKVLKQQILDFVRNFVAPDCPSQETVPQLIARTQEIFQEWISGLVANLFTINDAI